MTIDFKTRVNRDALLEQLTANMAQHRNAVIDARKGYLKEAAKWLAKQSARVAEVSPENAGQISMHFSCNLPEDHTDEYESAIAMLKWHEGHEVELSSSEFRNLVEDKWRWMEGWAMSNRRYGSIAEEYAATKGF